MKEHSILKVSTIEGDKKPTSDEAKLYGARLLSNKGVVWQGMSATMVNEFGRFKRDETVWGLDNKAIEALRTRNGFKVLE